MGEAGGGYCYPGWPERRLAGTMQAMRGNGWSIEGLARVFRLTPAGATSPAVRNQSS